jgi:hypothetical protein
VRATGVGVLMGIGVVMAIGVVTRVAARQAGACA